MKSAGASGLRRLDAAAIENQLREAGCSLGHRVHVVEKTESTNRDAIRAADLGARHGEVFVAEEQTRGRGRRGRTWFSPPGQNLYASCVLRPTLPVEYVPALSVSVGLAVRDALAKLLPSGVVVGLKWPNDVLVGSKKVAGILAEGAVQAMKCEYAVVGFGINVLQDSFPEDLEARATSLKLLGSTASREDVLVEVLRSVELRTAQLEEGGLALMQSDIAHWNVLSGRKVSLGGVTGHVVGIDGLGRLQVRTVDGSVLALASGEVSLHEDGEVYGGEK